MKQQQKWCDISQILPTKTLWTKINKNNYFATSESKLRSFPTSLNLKSIVTNVQVHGLEIVNSNCCLFCLEEPEIVIHLFCKYKIVDTFWCDVSDSLSVNFFYNFFYPNRHKLFGFEENNALLLCAKFLICK